MTAPAYADENDVVLESGGLRLVLAPALGGCIRRFDASGHEVLRAGDVTATDPRSMACFPLFPFSSRIFQGRFIWEGNSVELPLNMKGEPHAIHGFAWQKPWDVSELTDNSVTLSIEDYDSPWPQPYRASQKFRLTEQGMTVDISLTNLGTGLMPGGFGLHPYFPKGDALLSTQIEGVWQSGETGVPQSRVSPAICFPTAKGNDLSAIPMAATRVDNGCYGWSGSADISWPKSGLAVQMLADAPLGHVVIYSPEEEYFCVEPVSHMVNAVHHVGRDADCGWRTIKAGETMSASVSFIVRNN